MTALAPADGPFFRFTEREVREMLAIPTGPISDERLAANGLARRVHGTQKSRVLELARQRLDVDWIFDELGGAIPKSSIRAYLSGATARGEIGAGWRRRRQRGNFAP